MRRKLRNHEEVAHYWANRVQGYGEASRVFFERDTIYSYGYHFPIARWMDGCTVLFNWADYSPSTSKHKYIVRRAIPSGVKIIEVVDLSVTKVDDKDSHDKNIRHFIDEINELVKKASRARSRREWYQRDAGAMQEMCRAYCQYFGLDLPAEAELDILSADVLEKVKQAELQRERELQAENKKKIKDWITGKPGAHIPRSIRQAYIRISADGERAETSQSADVPLREARILWKRIQAGKPIHGAQIGHYTVISWNGELKIGCHRFSRAEVMRFGAVLDSTKAKTKTKATA